MQLKQSLHAWGKAEFEAIFKRELASADLPLQDYLRHSSVAVTDSLAVMVLKSWDDADNIHVKVGIFFAGIIAGCNCADDPTPVPEQPEYAEFTVQIDKHTGIAQVV